MNPRKQFCYFLPALYMAALSLYGQTMVILPVMTIAPGKVSPIVVNTFPGAACSLEAKGDAGTSHDMALYANDQGQVRFYVQAHAESIAPAKLGLQCNSATQTVNYNIEISANAATTPTGATLAAETGIVRPPLAGNPLALSQSDLLRGNYPLRPDPVQAPEAYATWLRMVTTPTTVIQPKLIEQPHRFHAAAAPSPVPPQPVGPSTAYSQYWSGLVLEQDPRTAVPFQLPPYDVVSAEWYVPAVTGAPDGDVEADSAFWTGMDGWDFNPTRGRDVLQGGTEQDVFTVTYQGILFTITNYYSWAEFFPSSEQLISNFNVGPGDHLVVQVFMTDGNFVDVNGFWGVCYVQNLTTGYAVRVLLNAYNASTTFAGNSAEWVMERPVSIALDVSRPKDCCDTQYLGSLANYSAATMLNAYAIRADSTVVNASGNLNSLNVTMTTLSDQNSPILSEVVPLNDTSMVFRWKGFK